MDLMSKIFGKRADAPEATVGKIVTKMHVNLEDVADQVQIFADVDGVSPETIQLHAAHLYCMARRLEEQGYKIIAVNEQDDVTKTLGPTDYS